jgi:hypothetical protein
MDGTNIYKTTLPRRYCGGAELNFKGLELKKNKLSIPRFGEVQNGKFKCSYRNRNY